MSVFTRCYQTKPEATEERHLYEILALGRAVGLGELYDARTDQFGPGFLKAKMAEDCVITKNSQTYFKTF